MPAANASSRPVILIDWLDVDTPKGCFLLRASVTFNGPGVAITAENGRKFAYHVQMTKALQCGVVCISQTLIVRGNEG